MGGKVIIGDFNVIELVTGLLGKGIRWDKIIRTMVRLVNEDNRFSLECVDYGAPLKVEKISKKLEVKDIKIELKLVQL